MGIIICLPKSNVYRTIMVVVERFLNYVSFIPTKAGFTAKECAKLFFKVVVKYQVFPTKSSANETQISQELLERVVRYAWNTFELLHQFHAQMDGQIEWVNPIFEHCLRHFLSSRKKYWEILLDMVKFSYNLPWASNHKLHNH